MTFINIVLCDLRNGILKRWKVFLGCGFLFAILAVLAYLDFEAAKRMDPSPVTSAVSLGDYFCYLFGGTSAGNRPIEFLDSNIVNSMFIFTFPSIWCLIYLVLLLITLQYPYEDLMGFGKHIIILSNKIHYWWMSKCIWIIATTITYFAVGVVFFAITALLLGAECNLNIGTYYPYFRFTAVDFLKDPPLEYRSYFAYGYSCRHRSLLYTACSLVNNYQIMGIFDWCSLFTRQCISKARVVFPEHKHVCEKY